MTDTDKLLVVIDPTSDTQIALEQALHLARPDARLHLYCTAFRDEAGIGNEAAKRAEIDRHRVWIQSLAEAAELQDTRFEIEVEWTNRWRDAIAPAAQRCNATMIVKATASHWSAGRRLLKTADWTLLRQAPCPVYFVKREPVEGPALVLLTIDLKRADDLHSALNERVIHCGKALASMMGDAPVHALDAYRGANQFVPPDELAAKAGVEPTHAHSVEGPAAKVILDTASQLRASVVVIGTTERDGAIGTMIGNTAEMELDKLEADVLAVPAH